MPIPIGRRPDHTVDQPLALLSDCHRRIEQFLDVLKAIDHHAAGGALTPAQREELRTALTYFATAAPKHTADEERTSRRSRQSTRSTSASRIASCFRPPPACFPPTSSSRSASRWPPGGSRMKDRERRRSTITLYCVGDGSSSR